MHETAVVMGLIGILERQSAAAGIGRISEVRVKLGRLRGLDARQLVAVFEILAEGELLDGARLLVEEVGVSAHCRACGTDYEVAGWALACPHCGADDVDVVHGRELHIESFDGIRREAEPPVEGDRRP